MTEVPHAVVVHAVRATGTKCRRPYQSGAYCAPLSRTYTVNGWPLNGYGVHLDGSQVTLSRRAQLAYISMKLWPRLELHHRSDKMAGQESATPCLSHSSALFACSYYAYEAFKPGPERSREPNSVSNSSPPDQRPQDTP